MVYISEKIAEHIWTIQDKIVRSFLIEGQDKTMLVDTGFGTGNIKEFCETLTDKPIFVVNTHADRDHVGCNGLFDEVYMHPADFDYYAYGKGAGLPAPKPLWEGTRLQVGDFTFEAVFLPGHTPGCIGLLEREKRFLIGGDLVNLDPIYMFGRGRNLSAYLCSMRKLNEMKDAFDFVYSCHGTLKVDPAYIPKLIDCGESILAHSPEITVTKAGGNFPETVSICAKNGVSFLYEYKQTEV